MRFDVKAGPTGSLFGSVTATDIADRLWSDHRVRVDRRKIELREPIKRVGRHEVSVELFTDVTSTLRLEIVPEGGDIAQMEELQAAAEAEERAAAEADAAAEAAEDVDEEPEPPAPTPAEEPEPLAVAEPESAVEAAAAAESAATEDTVEPEAGTGTPFEAPQTDPEQ